EWIVSDSTFGAAAGWNIDAVACDDIPNVSHLVRVLRGCDGQRGIGAEILAHDVSNCHAVRAGHTRRDTVQDQRIAPRADYVRSLCQIGPVESPLICNRLRARRCCRE